MFNYVKIHFNMPIKILQTFSGSYNFIKINQNKMINVYFQEPSSICSICESEFKTYRLYTARPQRLLWFLRLDSLKSALAAFSISRTHPGTFMRPLYLRSWELELNFWIHKEQV